MSLITNNEMRTRTSKAPAPMPIIVKGSFEDSLEPYHSSYQSHIWYSSGTAIPGLNDGL